MTVISGICRLGLIRGYMKINPFAEKQILLEKNPDEEWEPFNDDDLKKIFDPASFQPEQTVSPAGTSAVCSRSMEAAG